METLTEKEIQFVCGFANRYISQIPYIEPHNVKDLVVGYLVKRIKSVLRQNRLSDIGIELANSVLEKLSK